MKRAITFGAVPLPEPKGRVLSVDGQPIELSEWTLPTDAWELANDSYIVGLGHPTGTFSGTMTWPSPQVSVPPPGWISILAVDVDNSNDSAVMCCVGMPTQPMQQFTIGPFGMLHWQAIGALLVPRDGFTFLVTAATPAVDLDQLSAHVAYLTTDGYTAMSVLHHGVSLHA